MAHLDAHQPSKIYRVMVEEVFSRRSEILPDATFELNVVGEPLEAEGETGTFGGKSVLAAFPELFGTEHGGPSDMSEHPEKVMQGFGETENPRTLEP